ncbi:DUF1430 domain-containing protein [Lactobacillus corticis]|uniref:Uncharacterized protein n=1 Tax=Lactobacillus corticis TaxID=2201249 RepID=A0A916VGX9_9LACO|nr:DUF1430 domain-containing protein [Lactobacillus corticis]GFZ26446.1 hypothetical protein LCB40_03260 [Lactobacillus corticis]
MGKFLEDEKIFSFAFFGGIILIMIYMYLENYRYSYHIMLFACVLAYLIVGVIIGINAIIRAKMHNYYTIIPAIKGDAHSNMAFFINLSIKIMIEVVLCVILASMLKTWNREQKMTAQLSEWTSHQTYYTVTIGTGTDTENHDVDKKSIKFANYMLDHGGMLIDFQGWGSKDVFDTVEGNHLLVNAKYLDNNKVLNLSGNRIHLSSNTKTTYLLIPERYYSKRKKLIKLYRTFLSLDEAEKTTGKSLSLKAIAIKNNQSHFLYSINSFDYGNYSGSVKDSLLVVVSHKSLGGGGWNNPANMNWTSYVSDSALMTNDLSLLHRAINKTGFTPYVGGILNTKSYAAKQIASTQKKLLVTVIVAIISIFLALFEDIAFNTVYISNNRKKLAIKRLMGANYLKQFGEFILIILGVGVVEATLVYLITQKLSLSLGVFIIGNLLELSLLMLQGMHLNKKISETIKGE